jgi:signal transduction histidine kinase
LTPWDGISRQKSALTAGKRVADSLRPARWSTVPLVLVVVLLLGSVLIPARETWRIMRLLRETAQVVEPARLAGARLELGLRAESAALEAYALSGDRVELSRYTAAAADDDRQLAVLADLARTLDAEAVDRTAAVRSRVGEWRELGRGLVDGRLPRAQLPSAMQARQASYDLALRDVTRLASYLAAEGSARRDVIRGSERFGLLVNTSLVIVALAAVLAVGALSYRERRLTVILRRRIEEDAALRGVTRALGAAATAEQVMRHIAEGTTAITNASGAYVECIVAGEHDAVDFVIHDRGEPSSLCTRAPLAGSLTEAITTRGSTGALMEIDSVAGWVAPGPAESEAPRAGLIAPMSASGTVFGALVVLRDRTSAPFADGVRRQMHTLADLASTALQRITIQEAERRALKEAELRARQQAALREAAEALAAAFTFDEVTQQIARTALEATQARGAFVEQIAAGTGGSVDTVVVRASTGSGVPALGSTAPFPGSRTEQAIESHEPIFVPDLFHDERPSTGATAAGSGCSAIVVRLGHGSAPIGALFIVNAAEAPFRPDDLARARTFGHLAALAYEKVGLLDEAREGRRALEQVLKSRSRLMRGFSHDVKNPLGAADGYAALLAGGIYGALTEAQAESIERIRGCIHGALGLIDDLHELARAETGHVMLSLSLVDLAGLVRASGDEYRAAAEARGLSLTVDVGADPPAVETDPARVRQIVGNLISNAIKYTARGSVTLRAWRQLPERAGEAEGWAVVEVRDTGPGIPVEKRDAIFEEFIRIGTDETSGAGLGLAISQRLAQALGGRMTVESEVGHGSAFSLWLPLRRPEAQDAAGSWVAERQNPQEIPSDARRTVRGIGVFSPEPPASNEDGTTSMVRPPRSSSG